MKKFQLLFLSLFCGMFLFMATDTQAGRKLKAPPAPLNKNVVFESYKDTDIALVRYFKSRREFRVGHSPFQAIRFHVAEFVLVAEHSLKYLRPDMKAEIKMARRSDQPELMANKVFQKKWDAQIKNYQKTIEDFKNLKTPKQAQASQKIYAEVMEDEMFVAQKISEHMFKSQQIRSRELFREDLIPKFREQDTEWFDRILSDFEGEANLKKFYDQFLMQFVEPKLKKAKEEAEKAMKGVGLEYATAVEEKKDILR